MDSDEREPWRTRPAAEYTSMMTLLLFIWVILKYLSSHLLRLTDTLNIFLWPTHYPQTTREQTKAHDALCTGSRSCMLKHSSAFLLSDTLALIAGASMQPTLKFRGHRPHDLHTVLFPCVWSILHAHRPRPHTASTLNLACISRSCHICTYAANKWPLMSTRQRRASLAKFDEVHKITWHVPVPHRLSMPIDTQPRRAF